MISVAPGVSAGPIKPVTVLLWADEADLLE
jgi:hypothetical protein